MPLIRAEKEALVEKLVSQIEQSKVALIVSYKNLNSQANLELRDQAFEQGGKIKMISNKLLALILKKTARALELPALQLAIAYGFEDEVTAAKTLVQFGKATDSLEVIGGWIDGHFFDAVQVKTLSSLPSKDELRAQVVGRLGGLIQGLVFNLNYPLQKLAYVIKAVEQSKN